MPVALLPAAGCRLPTTAFTLIEMLVALALVGTIVTMVYGSFTAVSRSLDLYGRRRVCAERTSLVLRLMTRQIRGAYAPSSAGATASPPSGTRSPPPAAFRADPHPRSGAALSFITTGGRAARREQPTPLSRVRYRYDPAHRTLSIGCEPYVNGADARPDPPRWQPILRGVTRMELQFYDGRGWQPQWDGSAGLPRAVKIALTVVDEKERSHEFGTMVSLGCRPVLPQPPSAAAAGK